MRHTSPVEQLRLLWLSGLRAVVGLCDLLVAFEMYALFILLQQRAPAHHAWWLPASLVTAALMTTVLVLLRSILDIGSIRSVVRYTQQIYTRLVLRLAQGYTRMPWVQFVASNRSELLNTTVNSAREAAFFYHLCIELTASILVVTVMAVALIYESPLAACALIATGSLLVAVHRLFIRKNLRHAAGRKEEALRGLQRTLLELFSLRKEVQVYANHGFFQRRIENQASSVADETLRLMVWPQVARTFSDQGVVLVFLAAIVVVALRHGDMQRTLSVLVFYFVLSRRLLPLISQISYMAGQMEGSSVNVELVDRELVACSAGQVDLLAADVPSAGVVLELADVWFGFSPEAEILRGVSLRLYRGEIVVLHGESGVGKSTLLHVIAGVVPPTSGVLHVDRASIAYVPQEVVLLDDSIRNNLLFGLDDKNDLELMRALAVASLDEFVAAQPMGLAMRVGDNGVLFSGGQRQRLGLARAILRGASLLLLDEATAALDPVSEMQVLDNLKAEGIAVLAVTHRSHARRFADREVFLVGGLLTEVLHETAELSLSSVS